MCGYRVRYRTSIHVDIESDIRHAWAGTANLQGRAGPPLIA